nr:MAK10-like protein [Tanacetum cinerariifolium]
MGNDNPICALGDYTKPSHVGYRNTIELPEENNVVPLRSETIGLVQDGCSFHKLRFEDPNRHLKDFLKLVDSVDLDVTNKERMRLRADNRPPMLEKDMYDSWNSIMELYMMNRQCGRMILESIVNGQLIWSTIKENRVTRPRKYSKLSLTDAIQADYDERECKLYDEFDKIAYKKEETLHPSPSCRPTKFEVPKELSKVSMVNTSLKKLKHHLVGFDVLVKERTTTTAIIEGSWGFDHTKACCRDGIIPFVNALKDIFNTFDQYLIDELTKVQNVFHQMEQAVEQHRLELKMFESITNQVLNENKRLLEQVINKDIMNIVVNSSMDNASVNVHECKKCLKLETDLLNKKDFFEKVTYDKKFRLHTTLEKHSISLEVDTQLNQEISQRDGSVSNQSSPNFN